MWINIEVWEKIDLLCVKGIIDYWIARSIFRWKHSVFIDVYTDTPLSLSSWFSEISPAHFPISKVSLLMWYLLSRPSLGQIAVIPTRTGFVSTHVKKRLYHLLSFHWLMRRRAQVGMWSGYLKKHPADTILHCLRKYGCRFWREALSSLPMPVYYTRRLFFAFLYLLWGRCRLA